MTPRETETIRDVAAQWHVALDNDDMDWDAFTAWLEADPRHRVAYDEIALTDAALEDHRAALHVPVVANDDMAAHPEVRRRRWWAWSGTAAAAALAIGLALPGFLAGPDQIYTTEATARQVTLADGSTVYLAPRSRLVLSGRDRDHLALNGGAIFDIRHDPARTLSVDADALTIRDIGTRFDVQAQDGHVRVSVAEGKVEVAGDPLAAPVPLSAGRGFDFDRAAGTSTVSAVRSEDVASWREGRLTYTDAPLSLVAADLARYAGVRVVVPDALRGRRFSGTLVIDDGDAAIRDLAEVMGLRLGGRAGARRLELPAR